MDIDGTFIDRQRSFTNIPDMMDQIYSSLDVYQNMSSEHSNDYISIEDLDVTRKEKFCPQESDFTANQTVYNFTQDDDVGVYKSMGV